MTDPLILLLAVATCLLIAAALVTTLVSRDRKAALAGLVLTVAVALVDPLFAVAVVLIAGLIDGSWRDLTAR